MLFLKLRIHNNLFTKLSLSENVFYIKDNKKANGHV